MTKLKTFELLERLPVPMFVKARDGRYLGVNKAWEEIFGVTARARAESALRESEERFRAVVDSANEGMLIYDRSLNIIAGNRAAERIIGLPLAQLIGKPGFTSLLPCVRADGTPLPEAERPTRATVRSGQAQTDLRIGIKRTGEAVTW